MVRDERLYKLWDYYHWIKHRFENSVPILRKPRHAQTTGQVPKDFYASVLAAEKGAHCQDRRYALPNYGSGFQVFGSAEDVITRWLGKDDICR
jgi:hypothetical protein